MSSLNKAILTLLIGGIASCGQPLVEFANTSAPFAPTVTSTDPINGATGVGVSRTINATFSAQMDPSTINTTTFTLQLGHELIPGAVRYAGQTATFESAVDLPSATTFTATITTGASSAEGETGLAANYTWTFTTVFIAPIPPFVSFTDPGNGATGLPANQAISATFSTPMDAATIDSTTFTLSDGTGPVPGSVTYSGVTAVFAPTDPLSITTTYTATITRGAQDVAGVGLAGNYVWTFGTGAPTPPMVIFTNPGNGSTGVALNPQISAIFSTDMNTATFTGATFLLKAGATALAGTVTATGTTTANFILSTPLTVNTIYSATITTGVQDAAGTALAANYTWTFTTGTPTRPTVIATNPGNGATGVPASQVVTATFSIPMNTATLTGTTFTLTDALGPVAGTVSSSGTSMAVFTPSGPLPVNTTFTAVITTGAQDLAGDGLAVNYTWSFTTANLAPPEVIATDPVDGAVQVPTNQNITATFNRAMNPATINGTTFTLAIGVTPVAGEVSYSGVTATFAPATALIIGTTYTATITTGAQDPSGESIAQNYVWSFTAAILPPPEVIATDPVDGATQVPTNQIITATFNRAMNPSTINGTTFTLAVGATPMAGGTVTYSGVTATFTPGSALIIGTTYTATITTGAQDPSGESIAQNYVWSFTAAIQPPPEVIATDPVDGETQVPTSQVITATFNRAMNPATINGSTFTLAVGATPVIGTVTYAGVTASFKPGSALIIGTTYTATMTTGAQDPSGESIAQNYVWSFTAAILPPPEVISTDPVDGATAVQASQIVSATFNRAMNPATLTGATFSLSIAGTPVTGGVVAYSGVTATYTPETALLNGTTYTATITTGAQDTAGEGLAQNYVWSFTTVIGGPTVIATNPVKSLVCQCIPAQVLAIFSVDMNPQTIDRLTFTGTGPSAVAIPGAVTYDAAIRTASFAPSVKLLPNTLYSMDITAGATDENGRTVAPGGYQWSFTTGASPCFVPVEIGSTSTFAVLAGNGFFNSTAPATPLVATTLNGDVGLSPIPTCTSDGVSCSQGVPQINGNLYINDPAGTANTAQNDLDNASIDAFNRQITGTGAQTVVSQLSGQTFMAGVYSTAASSSMTLSSPVVGVPGSGIVTLDAQGDQNGVWIFQVGSDLTVGNNGRIALINGAKAVNVFWAVGSQSSLGTNVAFNGTVLAQSSISDGSGSTVDGRLLSEQGSVTLVSDVITVPSP